MQITVKIRDCRDCRHIDHSGAFTVRGARLICSHSNACQRRVSKDEFRSEYPEYAKRDLTHFKYHWIHRVLTKGNKDPKVIKIPDWCPLKHGAKY